MYCNCWIPSSPPPKQDISQCNNRKQKEDERCTEEIRQMYYNETINCDCPPRCTELSFEKFVSTGQELQQCSILTTANFGGKNNPNGNNNEVVEIVNNKNEDDDDDSNDEDAEMKLDKNNLAKVVVYFQSLSYQEITQYPKYTVTTLLGAIGGILGVYMGFSFLALFEVFDLFGRVFCCIVPPSSSSSNERIKSASLQPLHHPQQQLQLSPTNSIKSNESLIKSINIKSRMAKH